MRSKGSFAAGVDLVYVCMRETAERVLSERVAPSTARQTVHGMSIRIAQSDGARLPPGAGEDHSRYASTPGLRAVVTMEVTRLATFKAAHTRRRAGERAQDRFCPMTNGRTR
jgi:hypothetical protein